MRVLVAVDARSEARRAARRSSQRGHRVVVEAAGANELDVVVGLEGVGDRRRVRERSRNVEEPEACGVVPAGSSDVHGRAAHHLEHL